VASATFSLEDVIIFADPISSILFPPRPTVIYHREGVSSILTQREYREGKFLIIGRIL
jgi:hypothetical protein